jgi:hypothetical protein
LGIQCLWCLAEASEKRADVNATVGQSDPTRTALLPHPLTESNEHRRIGDAARNRRDLEEAGLLQVSEKQLHAMEQAWCPYDRTASSGIEGGADGSG